MSERSNLISKLQSDFKTRVAYIQAKVGTLVPSQIRALRLKSEMPRQPDLACAAEMQQSRISMLETAGANPTLSTLSSIAAALKVGLVVKFVPFSEMLAWENGYSQDNFNVVRIDNDRPFLNPALPTATTQSATLSTFRASCAGFIDAMEPINFAESPIRVFVSDQPISEPTQDFWDELKYQDVPVQAEMPIGSCWPDVTRPYSA